MKKYMLSLFCAALAGTAWAQGQAPSLPIPGTNNVTQISANVGTATGGCAKDCCPQTKTVCIPQPATKVTTKVLFSSSCETACHKGILQLLKKSGDCNTCQTDGSCGCPYVKRDLYKRVEKTECPSYKCVPVQVPVCNPAPCAPKCANGVCIPGTVASAQVGQTPMAATTAALAITTSPVQQTAEVRPTLGFVTTP